MNFLRVGRKVLLDAVHPDIRRMATDYFQRAAAIGDESDQMALRDFSARPA